MKAIVQDRYGTADVLKLEDIDEPCALSDGLLDGRPGGPPEGPHREATPSIPT